MRAILNELFEDGTQSVHEVEVKDYTNYYKHIGNDCRAFDVVYIQVGEHRLSVFCDDEGMLKSGNLGRLVGNYPQPLFGNVVVVGDVDERGNTLPFPEDIGLDEVFEMFGGVEWQVR